MKKSDINFTLMLVLLAIIITTSIYFLRPSDAPVVEVKGARSFEECVTAGNPVMESYPRKCSDKVGNQFTENIGNTLEKMDKIILANPVPNQEVTSPLVIKGQARGNWFFEASFPVFLTDWDGKIIAEGIAQAEGDWMTTNFVPYTATLNYIFDPQSYSNRGTLILKKDNPSGLPENDDALEIPVLLK